MDLLLQGTLSCMERGMAHHHNNNSSRSSSSRVAMTVALGVRGGIKGQGSTRALSPAAAVAVGVMMIREGICTNNSKDNSSREWEEKGMRV
jgi:hypothetical protein